MQFAGTPCVDFSGMPGGIRLGAIGSAAVPYFTWLALRLLLQEDIIVHENVPGFLIELITNYASELYIIMSVVMSLAMLGRKPKSQASRSILVVFSAWNTVLTAAPLSMRLI